MKINELAKIRSQIKQLQAQQQIIEYDWAAFVERSLIQLAAYPACVAQLSAVKNITDLRYLLRRNLFILLTCACQRKHLINKWSYNRCADIQKNPNGFIDLWAREHYKSTIVTFGKSLQDIIITHGRRNEVVSDALIEALSADFGGNIHYSIKHKRDELERHDIAEEVTIGILSCTKKLAESFLWEIKKELEQNEILHALFDDIFYKEPDKMSDKWSVQVGINVKRQSIRKEATVEAWGLITGQPTSKHFSLCVYDDIITHDIVKTLYLTHVATISWENSLSLSCQGGVRRYVGTRKHYNDTYTVIIEREAAILRRYTPYLNNDKAQGLALFEVEELAKRRKSMGESTFAAEYLQEPLQDSAIRLDVTKLCYHNLHTTDNLMLYLFGDPASSEKSKHTPGNDYTVYVVIGIDRGGGLYLIDGVRDRLTPSEKWSAIYGLWKKYQGIKNIYYEQVGLCADIAYFKERAEKINHLTFSSLFISLTPRQKKEDRLIRLEPLLEERKLFVPRDLQKRTVQNEPYNLTHALVKEEMTLFPFSKHDDIMDCLAHAAILLETKAISGIIDDRPRQPILMEKDNNKSLTFDIF